MNRVDESRVDEQRRGLARSVRSWSIDQLHEQLRDAGVTRAFVVYENGEFHLSHPKILRPLQAFFELSQDFAQHEAVFIGREEGIPTVFFAFVHDTRRGLAQGGLRFWHYDNVAELLTDGVRLSQGMTRKNSLAGLWWGGGKGIVALPSAYKLPHEMPERSPDRVAIFEAYGRFIASLGGVYYTAEDVGTKTSDMDTILSRNRFVTCISPQLGGSGNPSPHTARGVFRALQAAWLILAKSERLAGVRVAVQGAGNVGVPLIDQLDEAGAEIWVSDVSEESLERLRQRRPRVHTLAVAEADRIFDLDVDVFAPCARGAVVNERTIPRLKARLVCGAANNILETPEDAERLRERGIAFVPDYVCNRMGITNCADEWHGYLEEDVRLASERVFPDTLRVLRHAQNLHVSSLAAANELADIAASELHPLLGHRGRRIVDHLIASGWHKNGKQRGRSVEPAFEPALQEPEIRVAWEKAGLFRGTGRAVAAMPVSTASRPNLASVLSPLLMDVRARALESLTGERPRRVAGSDHGGLALQLAVERSLPYERQAVGRPELFQICRDQHDRNDAALREQLHQLGAGYDPEGWLDPMDEAVSETVVHLFDTLVDEGAVIEENRLAYRCPRCESVLVASDLQRARIGTEMGWRCGRCETGVEPDSSPQLFVQMEGMAGPLRRAIEDGAVVFSSKRWMKSVLADLDTIAPWCISRQYWWGNEIPEHFKDRPKGEVLSSWFSLAAWTLRALGWPGTATPIEDVFVDPAWLQRWVVPSQLLALHLTGQPAFRRVHVHGTVKIRDRSLVKREDAAPEETRDEERWQLRTVLRPMRKDLGNVVEPATLIRRFGADALRLGFLLALDRGPEESVTLGEGELYRARRAVQSLVSKVTGLYGMVRGPLRTGPPRLADRWIVARCAAAALDACKALEEHRYTHAAEHFVQAAEAFVDYANGAADRRHKDGGDLGAVRAAAFQALQAMKTAFSPLCPFLMERLIPWMDERCPEAERSWTDEPWAAALEQTLVFRSGRAVALDGQLDGVAAAEIEELARITGAQLEKAGDAGPV